MSIFRRQIALFIALTILATSLLTVFRPGLGLALSSSGIISLTNSERSANGLAPLAWNGALSNSAAMKSQDMCTKGYWAHTAPDGATAWTFISRAGYNYITAGENLARDFTSDSSVVAGWMASSGHRANILNSSFMETGVATTTCSLLGVQTALVVAHYGSRTAPTPAPSSPPAPAPTKKTVQPRYAQTGSNIQEPAALPIQPPVPVPVVKVMKFFDGKFWSLSYWSLNTWSATSRLNQIKK